MRLTSFTDYGLRFLICLAAEPGRALSTAEIATRFDLSRHHLAKVVQALAAHGFVKTQRGKGGGAELAKPAEEIAMGEVVRLLERGQTLVTCFTEDVGSCDCYPECQVEKMLSRAEERFIEELNRTTLADCAAPQKKAALEDLNPAND